MKKAQRKPTRAARSTPKKASRRVAKKATVAKSVSRARNSRSAPARNAAAGLGALQRRLQNLEDIMEISRLQAAYCDAGAGGWNRRTPRGEKVASMVVDDGAWD